MAQFDSRRRTGRRPRTQAEFFRAMESMGEALFVNAIFGGSPITTYEVNYMYTCTGVLVGVGCVSVHLRTRSGRRTSEESWTRTRLALGG